jgi:hypothetical protein
LRHFLFDALNTRSGNRLKNREAVATGVLPFPAFQHGSVGMSPHPLSFIWDVDLITSFKSGG